MPELAAFFAVPEPGAGGGGGAESKGGRIGIRVETPSAPHLRLYVGQKRALGRFAFRSPQVGRVRYAAFSFSVSLRGLELKRPHEVRGFEHGRDAQVVLFGRPAAEVAAEVEAHLDSDPSIGKLHRRLLEVVEASVEEQRRAARKRAARDAERSLARKRRMQRGPAWALDILVESVHVERAA